ncbi:MULTISPECIES: aldose epimerase family protein [Prochlorococcus]|uniref:Galactose mutarotase related enzyme n=1 Tax=Prochlorococcus marinus (strain SARG / CCMP1375 / SS120) TaxID=167539 RepID=Q7V9S1_PROMA|nr:MULTISPECIES: galactose mutarotase [Prochlorococcus]AAQ00800.1 Galactose mutarotase related enzyme [Prochlorococcus marinus subsp. marinus str. CCMP1375]KGG10706.1 Galactose mutarotase [Prochlorococcus marinus str. LG]KGG21127.1 Galactose mutarotase [Prochlorococcus marinus str. SS2]KGG23951.1 Galactose mutarotase [Prochlorococcus marinus str. SS35]KGG31788.1 Galactose mutarotase [Prochlorococcus marinus str. SS51]
MSVQLTERNEPYSHWEYSDENNQCRLRIVPERGGLITEWLSNGREVLYFDLDRFQQTVKSVRGGMPILFPICGDLPRSILRLPQGEFSLNQHGFARDAIWEINLLNDHKGFSLTMNDSPQTIASYPYFFSLAIEVRPSKNTLEIKSIVHNRGEENMPFSFGIHPYFKVTDLTEVSIAGLPDICFNHLQKEESLTSKQIEKLSEGVDFLSNGKGPFYLKDLLTGTTIEMKYLYPFNNVVVWTDPPRNMVCLEPWTSPRNSLNSGEQTLFLNPREYKELICTFLVSQ